VFADNKLIHTVVNGMFTWRLARATVEESVFARGIVLTLYPGLQGGKIHLTN
jgi:hypothetical protein